MPNLKELRKRLSTTRDTKKIATAMTLVSSSKFRRSQEAYNNAGAYADGLLAIFQRFIAFAKRNSISLPILGSTSQVNLYIVITSDKGLCGSFNTQVQKTVLHFAQKDKEKGLESKFISIGTKGTFFLERFFSDKILMVESSRPERLEKYIEKVLNFITEVGASSSYIIYNKFTSSVKQEPVCEPLVQEVDMSENSVPLFDISPFSIEYFQELVRDTIQSFLYRKLLESSAGEEGARMLAMDNATRNANKMIDQLTTQCNRTRQSIITTELTEIISGAEALE